MAYDVSPFFIPISHYPSTSCANAPESGDNALFMFRSCGDTCLPCSSLRARSCSSAVDFVTSPSRWPYTMCACSQWTQLAAIRWTTVMLPSWLSQTLTSNLSSMVKPGPVLQLLQADTLVPDLLLGHHSCHALQMLKIDTHLRVVVSRTTNHIPDDHHWQHDADDSLSMKLWHGDCELSESHVTLCSSDCSYTMCSTVGSSSSTCSWLIPVCPMAFYTVTY